MTIEKTIRSWFKMTFLILTIMVFIFILMVVCVLVTYPPLSALLLSILSPELQFAITLSLITSCISTILCLIIAIPVGYALSRYNFPGKSMVMIIISLPLALPPIVSGIALLLFFGIALPGKILNEFSISILYTPYAIIIAQFFVNLPYLIRVLTATFDRINPRYEYVAKTLGAGDFIAFQKIALPMAKESIAAGTIITWSKATGEFGAILMVAGATRMKTETLPIAVFLNLSTGDINMAIAAATILIIISVVSYAVFDRIFKPTYGM